ncbi:MAG: YfhO family protein [Chloroflexia bacterium]|nr:YfhO family protein [Chloroflexia bacterium]
MDIRDSLTFVDESHFSFLLYQSFTDSLRKDTFAINSFKQDNIKGSITLSKPKLLFFTIPFNQGWRVNVNGKNQRLSRVNIGFTGIFLPAGTHQLELYFVPEYYQLTSWVSWVSVALFWLYLGYYVMKKRKKQNETYAD